jgi:phosphoglycerol transferase
MDSDVQYVAHYGPDPAPDTRPIDNLSRHSILHSTIAYLLAAILATAGMLATTGFWQNNLHVPFNYGGGDAIWHLVAAKTIQETGWFNFNPRLGAPGTLDMGDFPMSEWLHLAIVKILNFVTGDYATSINLYYLLTFPLTAVITLAALGQLEISLPLAVVAAAIYALAPFHILRGNGPVFLGGYFLLPLVLLLSIQLARGRGPTLSSKARPNRYSYLAAAAIVILTASTGVYYAFFSSFFIAFGAVLGAIRLGRWRYLTAPVALIGLIVLAVVVNVSHSLIYHARAGPNPQVAIRKADESEKFGLRLSYLLLPIADHRLAWMNDLRDQYKPVLPPESREVTETALGLVGTTGLVALLLVVLLSVAGLRLREPLGEIAALNIAGLLLATTGGLGAIVACLILPQIRSYDRMDTCLEFFALAGLAILIDRAVPVRWRSGRAAPIWIAILGLLFVAAALDQTPATQPDFAAHARAFDSDHRFVRRIESRVPQGSMIFELPCIGFPEQPSFGGMLDYDLFRGYLHSSTLRWSYGAMIGRPTFDWQINTRALPTAQFVQTIKNAGFVGIYLDRFSRPRDLEAIENDLESATGHGRFASDDGRLVFFPLIP